LQALKKATFEDLALLARGSQSDPFSTPFQPKDYNRGQFKFEFAKEYIGAENLDSKLEEVDFKEVAISTVQQEKTEVVD